MLSRLHTKAVAVRLLIPLGLLVTLCVTRWPLAPRYLFYFDSVNFALAVEDFNPALHQPQPPGYLWFVLLLRLVHQAVPDIQNALVLAGILTAWLALLFLRSLGDRMFGPPAGLVAALLLLFHPAFWLSGLSNQVRLLLAAGAAGIALLIWRVWTGERSASGLLTATFALGAAAGFRPDLVLFLLPLLVAAGWRNRISLQLALLAALLLPLGLATWLAPTLWTVGGPQVYGRLIADYLPQQCQGSSLLFGAPLAAALDMALAAALWNVAGLLPWIWALPFVKSPNPPKAQSFPLFLALWFAPAFLFHALVHVGDPDQTLVTVPVLSLLGARALQNFTVRVPGSRWTQAWPVTLAVALSVVLFFRPLPGPGQANGFRAVRYVDRITQATFRSLRELQSDAPLFLISNGSEVSWRQLSYYFPDQPLLVLDAAARQEPWLLQHRKLVPVPRLRDEILLPSERRIVWLDSGDPRLRLRMARQASEGWRRHGAVAFRNAGPSLRFAVGPYRFATAGSL